MDLEDSNDSHDLAASLSTKALGCVCVRDVKMQLDGKAFGQSLQNRPGVHLFIGKVFDTSSRADL